MIFMVDTVIGGKMLGPDAVAAVAIGLPVAEFMMSFMLLILQGCFSKLIQYMGRGDKDGFHRTYSLSFWLTIVVGLICTLVPIVFAPLYMIQCTMNGFFECTEQTIMSMAFAIVPEALLYPMIMVLLAKPLGPMAIWIGMGMSIVPLILVIYLFFGMMDLKTFCDEERIEIIIRNYDQPYNPLDFELDPEDFSKIGIYMMQKQAKNINYIYAFHLNVVTVTLDKI